MMKPLMKHVSAAAVMGAAVFCANPALALTELQVAAINSGALDLVQDFTLNPRKTAEAARKLAASNTTDPSEAAEVTGAILSAVQKISDNRELLFAVGQGVTQYALSYGDTNPTAISIGTTIGQIGKVAAVNGCVNAAGVNTKVGLACDPVTSDLLQGRGREGSVFGAPSEAQASHLSDNQIAAINSGALDIVQSFTLDPDSVPEQTRLLAASNTNDPSQAPEVTGAILSAIQKVSENPSGLFAVGEGVTKFALSFGDTNPTAVSIGTTIGQIGTVPVINACVNTAGVGTQIGLACDPPTSDILQGRSSDSPTFGSSGENPNQDDPSPH